MEEEKICQFLDEITVVELIPEIKKMTILIRRTHKIKLPDAIIVATAQSLEAKIFTNDTHMTKILYSDVVSLALKETNQ